MTLFVIEFLFKSKLNMLSPLTCDPKFMINCNYETIVFDYYWSKCDRYFNLFWKPTKWLWYSNHAELNSFQVRNKPKVHCVMRTFFLPSLVSYPSPRTLTFTSIPGSTLAGDCRAAWRPKHVEFRQKFWQWPRGWICSSITEDNAGLGSGEI